MEILLSILVGVALSAACGFRVFVPLLVVSLASISGHMELSESLQWMGTWPAFLAFAVATVLEIAAYYIPFVDNALDTVASPAAVVAGILVSAAAFTDVSPILGWALAVVAGGGTAGLVQGATVSARGAATVATAGTANPVVSTMEAGSSLAASLVAVLVPMLSLVVLVVIIASLVGLRLRRRQSVAASPG